MFGAAQLRSGVTMLAPWKTRPTPDAADGDRVGEFGHGCRRPTRAGQNGTDAE